MVNIIKIESKSDLQAAFKIREDVFVIEQNVDRDEEYDEFEDSSIHFLALIDNKPVGTARWRVKGDKVKLERFAVLKNARGSGVGAALVTSVVEDVKSHKLEKQMYMHAQVHAVPFYEKLGFKKQGDLFLECEIEHYTMVKN